MRRKAKSQKTNIATDGCSHFEGAEGERKYFSEPVSPFQAVAPQVDTDSKVLKIGMLADLVVPHPLSTGVSTKASEPRIDCSRG